MSHTELDVLIVGGGISGLTTAWWLAQKGLRVQVWEKSSRAGGKIQSNTSDGFQTEQAASMIMNFKAEVDQFFSASGLDAYKTPRQINAQNSRYLIHQGQIQSLPMTISGLFCSSLWTTQGKLRLLSEPFMGKSKKDHETVSEFISRRLGNEFLEKALEPFIAGTLASDPDCASAQHVIPRLTALEKRFGSITAGIIAHKIMGKRTARNPESFSFKNGMETLPQQLANEPKVGFHAAIEVQQLRQYPKNQWHIQGNNSAGEISCTARHVVLSCPAQSAAQLLKTLSPVLSQQLDSINYAPLSVVHIGLQRNAVKHPLDSVGFLVPRQEQTAANIKINGNLWMSSVFSGRAPDNSVLLSSYLGGSRHPDAINLSSEQSIDQVLHDIRPLLGISSHSTPLMARVDKHRRALPLYHGDYGKKLAAIDRELQYLPGLHLAANYMGGVSVRDRILCAKNTATDIINRLSLEKEPPQQELSLSSFLNKTAIQRPA